LARSFNTTTKNLSLSQKSLESFEIELNREFDQDLNVLQDLFGKSQKIIRESLQLNPIWKLFWNADYFVEDILIKLRNHEYIQAEYQVLFS
jgi:hypothetical protein